MNFSAFSRIAVFATAAAVLSAGQAAALEVFSCKPKDTREAGNWIAPEIIVAREPGADTALVDDAVIQYFTTGPIKAKVETDNAKRTTFTWKLKTANKSQNVTMLYRLTIQKADLSASFVTVPQGYANTWQVQGKCKKLKG